MIRPADQVLVKQGGLGRCLERKSHFLLLIVYRNVVHYIACSVAGAATAYLVSDEAPVGATTNKSSSVLGAEQAGRLASRDGARHIIKMQRWVLFLLFGEKTRPQRAFLTMGILLVFPSGVEWCCDCWANQCRYGGAANLTKSQANGNLIGQSPWTSLLSAYSMEYSVHCRCEVVQS